jgi:septal ring factor EnvC (AmiA/AmiB activator)
LELEHRVIKLELRVEDHAEDLKRLQDISDSMKKSLAGIEKTLAQIKWIATGAVVALFGQAMGLDKVMKIILS